MQRVWSHPELEIRLADAVKQLFAAEQLLTTHQSLVAEQAICTEQQASTIAHQASTIALQASSAAQQTQTLAQQQLQVNALTQHLENTTAVLAHSEHARKLMVNSRLWRATQPLRAVAADLKSLSKRSIARPMLRTARMLVTKGPLKLANQVKAIFAATPAPPLNYPDWAKAQDNLLEKNGEQLRKTIADWQRKPLISIVMPVYNPPLEIGRAHV